MIKHYVTFLSPGAIVAESSTVEIEDWDTDKAMEMARGIRERHGATPYCFYFTTRKRDAEDFDSYEVKRSGTYFLGGTIETLSELSRTTTFCWTSMWR